MPWPIPTPRTAFQEMRVLLSKHTNCGQARMDDACYAEIPEFSPPVGWRGVVRDRARTEAIHWLWGVTPQCQTINRLMILGREAATMLNPYLRPDERVEFEVEFNHEVRSRVDVMIAMHRSH